MFNKKPVEEIKTEVLTPKPEPKDDGFDPFAETKDEPVNEQPKEEEQTESVDSETEQVAETEEDVPADNQEKVEKPVNQEIPDKYKELEQLSGLWEMAKQDPVGFFSELLANTTEQLPSKEEAMMEVLKKYGEDFEYDPTEAYKNPKSDSAKYKSEIDKIEMTYQMKAMEENNNRKRAVAEAEVVYREGQKQFADTIAFVKKEYGMTDEEVGKIVTDIGNPNAKAGFAEKLKAYNELLCKYLKVAAKANKGLNKIKNTLNVENQIDAVTKKAVPSTPTGGKSGSTPKPKVRSINDVLMEG